MRTEAQYQNYRKPTWAPPAWLFGPVWTVLYILIAISFGYVAYTYFTAGFPLFVVLPFVLNLIFNVAFTPIQFRLRSFKLAAIDVLLVWATLIWAMVMIYPYAPWVAYINIPYLLWTSFASVLQLTVTAMNTQ
ncbi:MAG TPA: TspO/MBR family protein [Candidatus Paceibacterota bacterium]|nr:TspO/MBR family protein [Candidatus Paceibacterota bacterium]